MNRSKAYLLYLVIPAVPYLLMIYSPETVDPIYQYLANGKGHKYVWVAILFVLLASLYFGIVFDAKASGVKARLVAFIKWYFAAVGAAAAAYILSFDSASFKYASSVVVVAIVGFYLYLISYGKKNA